MRFRQSEVQDIIRSTYGNNAEAIGSNEDDGILTIFWLYKGEDEEDFKVLTLNL